ncbi:MAG: hypothetical protein M3Y33_18530 [Actinomycetota bacterium]|nr:hypothetical protein [Actinomycetota bacterium]
MTAVITVSIWHNVTRDGQGRRTGPGGLTPGDEMVKVFTYDLPAYGRDPAVIAEDAFAAFNEPLPGLGHQGRRNSVAFRRDSLTALPGPQ